MSQEGEFGRTRGRKADKREELGRARSLEEGES